MPQLRVEYAKSGRARCSLRACSQLIARHELRIGTAVVFPPRAQSSPDPSHSPAEPEEGATSYKWRHLCCFTQQQLHNAAAAGDLDMIEGFDDLAPADQALVDSMKRGELVEQASVKGRVGDIANSRLAAELLPKGASPAKKTKSASSAAAKPTKASTAAVLSEESETKAKRTRTTKRPREKSEEKDKDGAESDATIEYDVCVVTSKPLCPYGEKCFRTGAEHMAEYAHCTDADGNAPSRPRAVIKGRK